MDILSTAVRLTASPGLEFQPEISANGQWVAQVVALDGAGAIELFPTAAPEQKRYISAPWRSVFTGVFTRFQPAGHTVRLR